MSAASPLQNLAAKPQLLSNSTHASLLLQRKCACGSPTSSLTGKCPQCGSEKRLQTKLAIGASNDPLELEADRIAERVLAAPANQAVGAAPLRIQRVTAAHASAETATAPASVDRVLTGCGSPLAPALRQDMEQRFGHDFSQVRVHSGSAAGQSARELSAHAYTVGRNIVFGAGRFAPATDAGRRLLAHELTHVVQQQAGVGQRLQRDGDKTAEPKTVAYRIKIPPGVASKEEFRRYAETVIFGRVVNKSWTASSSASEVYADITKHVGTEVQFEVEAGELTRFGGAVDPAAKAEKKAADQAYAGLASTERQGINEEIDKRYDASQGTQPGVKIKAGESGKIAIWNSFKRQVMADKRKLDALPPEIRNFLLDDNAVASIEAKDFEQVLHIVSKVSALTPAELAEYKSRVTARTTDWSVYEASVDRFLAERKEREATVQERRSIETRLYGLDALYDRYIAYLSLLKSSTRLAALGASNPRAGGASLGTQPTLNTMRSELDADLIAAGFGGGIADFAKFIDQYETVFERETLAIARVMLDQYDHTLWKEEQRYQNAAEASALYDALSQSQAKTEYEEADKIRAEHATSIVMTPDEMADQAYWVSQRNAALARGQAKVGAAAAAHPLVGRPDFDRERLAKASKSEVQALMLGYIQARRKDIESTRSSLKDKPTMIYGLDALLAASFQAQAIQKGSIFEKTVKAHISDVHWSEAIPQFVLAVTAVAAGLLTGGSGTLAVLAAGTALGIGAYQAVEEFRKYEMKSAAYGAQLTTDDPSMIWVVVAVMAAAIDAGAFAAALPKLRPALQAFNAGAEAGDVGVLAAKLEKLADVEESIRNSILKAAEAEVDARAALKAIVRPPAVLRSVIIPGAEEFGRLVYAVYLTIKRGIREFHVFVKSNEAVAIIGDVAKLTPEELASLKVGYLKAIEEMEAVALHGKTLGMADGEVQAFMNLRGNTKAMTAEQVAVEMTAWKAVKSSGIPFGFDTVEKFEAFKTAAATGLKKARYADAEAILQGSAASGISYKKQLPFGTHSDIDVAVAGRSVFERARKLGYPVESNPMRIGPLKPDQLKELDLGAMHRTLTEAAGGRKVNFMIFGNRKSALQGIAGVKPESIPFK